MRIEISFPGGPAVNALLGKHIVRSDQPLVHGGTDSAPPPMDLFLASIGTCAGFYALRFCQKRDIDTSELEVELEAVRDESAKRFSRLVIHVRLPSHFPDKYRAAIVRAIDQCAVKQHIFEPPEFAVEVTDSTRR